MITSKHTKLTNEVYTEVVEVYKTLSEPFHLEFFPADKLPLALKALAMEPPLEKSLNRSRETEGIDLKEFVTIVADDYIEQSHWSSRAITDSFRIFDKDGNGYIDGNELKRVFTKLGENLEESEMVDQVSEFDIDGDAQMVLTEWFQMVLGTTGADFNFDDA